MILTQANIPYNTVARAWKDNGFRDSYAWHQRIWEAFPGPPEGTRNFLTRLDDTGQGFRLLILSPEPPTRPDWCPSGHWKSKTIAHDFYHHSHYHFSLLANPTVKRIVRDAQGNRKKNGKRLPLVHRDDREIDGKTVPGLETWFSRKAQLHGFALVKNQPLKINPRPNHDFIKKGKAGRHHAIEFSGVLTVVDQTLFQEAAVNGIGTAKAFGFGMLCLAPVS